MDLPAYVARRLLQMVPVVLGVTILVFFMIHLVPGDPARTMLGTHATPERIALLHKEWGLDQSLPEQYGKFMQRLVHGDLGDSLFYRVPARELIVDRLPVTLWLIGYGTVLSILIALPLAAHRGQQARRGPRPGRAGRAAGRARLPGVLGRDHAAPAFGLQHGPALPGRRLRRRASPATCTVDVPAGAHRRDRASRRS